MAKKKRSPEFKATVALIVFTLLYWISPVDLDPGLPFTDVVVTLISSVLIGVVNLGKDKKKKKGKRK